MDMDGANRRLIITSSLRWPNALAVDTTTRRVFWGDGHLDYIGFFLLITIKTQYWHVLTERGGKAAGEPGERDGRPWTVITQSEILQPSVAGTSFL